MLEGVLEDVSVLLVCVASVFGKVKYTHTCV